MVRPNSLSQLPRTVFGGAGPRPLHTALTFPKRRQYNGTVDSGDGTYTFTKEHIALGGGVVLFGGVVGGLLYNELRDVKSVMRASEACNRDDFKAIHNALAQLNAS
ncbi:hypothetical protein JCM8097_007430 [Rhodosporidiobolus ruineniae]